MAILAALNCLASFAPALDQALNEKLHPLIEGQGLKPVHAQPGTTFMKEVIDARTAWAERQFLGAFRRNHATAPKEELEVAVQFVRDALRFRFERDYRTGTQTARRLFDQAARLMGEGFEYSNDPLVVWLASTVAEAAVMKFPQPYPGALSRLDLPKERYTVALDFLILGDDAKATGRSVFAAINAADEILADPASYRPEEEEIFVHLCLGLIDADPVVSSEAMEKLVEHPRLSEWARCVLRGYFQIGQARRHAKPELDESETRARRALSRENVAKARDAALRAWEVDPKKPQGATLMIIVCDEGGGAPDDSPVEWFYRAIAARMDYLPAYRSLIQELNFGFGTPEQQVQIAGLALACAATDRPDTEIPMIFFDIMDRLSLGSEDWRPLYRSPVVSAVIASLVKDFAADPKRVAKIEGGKSMLAANLWYIGDYEGARRLAGGSVDLMACQTLKMHRCTQREMLGEIEVQEVGGLDDWLDAEKAYVDGRMEEAAAKLDDLAGRFADRAQPALLKTRLDAVGFEREFKKGGWVPVRFRSDLTGWTVYDGKWSVTEDGSLTATSSDDDQRFLIIHEGRVGGSFEVKGEYVLPRNDQWTVISGIGLVCGWQNDKGLEPGWITCSHRHVASPGSGIDMFELLDRFSGRQMKQFNGPGESIFKFNLQCRDGAITLIVNGKTIHDHETVRGFDPRPIIPDGENLPTVSVEESGRMGFGKHLEESAGMVSIKSVEVRRLGDGE